MSIIIPSQDQASVDAIRIHLTQAVIDLAEVRTGPEDLPSRQAKERALEGLRDIRDALNDIGFLHTQQRRQAHG